MSRPKRLLYAENNMRSGRSMVTSRWAGLRKNDPVKTVRQACPCILKLKKTGGVGGNGGDVNETAGTQINRSLNSMHALRDPRTLSTGEPLRSGRWCRSESD